MISNDGRLVLSGLDGCVFAKSGSNGPASLKQSSSRDSRGGGGAHKPAVPSSMLSTSSPETVLGSPADKYASTFIAAVVCVYILTGKTLFKVKIDYMIVDH